MQNLYRDVELVPGASTQHHLFTQHELSINGPMFNNPAEGRACLLKATRVTGQPAIVKMLAGGVALGAQQQQQQPLEPGGSEAVAYRCVLYCFGHHSLP